MEPQLPAIEDCSAVFDDEKATARQINGISPLPETTPLRGNSRLPFFPYTRVEKQHTHEKKLGEPGLCRKIYTFMVGVLEVSRPLQEGSPSGTAIRLPIVFR
jgi:hypothetical protein